MILQALNEYYGRLAVELQDVVHSLADTTHGRFPL